MTKKIDELNRKVTSAIFAAQDLERQNSRAWAKVSRIEEELADNLSPRTVEGQLARRGAVRAAIKAGNTKRAQRLLARFLAEPTISKKLSGELQKLIPS